MKPLILLSVACIALSSAAEREVEPEAAASKPLIFYPRHQDHVEHHEDHGDDDRHDLHDQYRGRYDDEDHDDHSYSYRPHHIRGHRYTSKERKIIEEVFSPDYFEPTIVLDYRYLKSGGRDYVRGPGGQILILPKNVRSGEHKEHHDYDSLIEFLRLRNLAKSKDDDNLGSSRNHENPHENHELPWY